MLLVLACAAAVWSPAVRAQHGAAGGEWRSYGGDLGSTKYSPLDQIGPDQLRRARDRLALAVGRRRARPRRAAREAAHRQHPELQGPRRSWWGGVLYITTAIAPGGGHRRRHGRDLVGPRPAGLPGQPVAARQRRPRVQFPGAGVLDRRGRGARAVGNQRGVPARRRRPDRGADTDVRRRRPRRPDGRHPARRARRGRLSRQQLDGSRLPAHRGARRGGHADGDLRLPPDEGGPAGLGEGDRRADRRDPVDVPHGAAGGRLRRRHVAERLVALLGQHQRLVDHERRRGARLRLPADRHGHQRLLRRAPPGRQPLRREPRRARHRDRPAHVALPVRAPRPVGLRHRLGAEPGGRDGRRAADQGRGAGHEAGVRLRLRPGHRRAGLADRGAARAARDDAGRRGVADAAVPDQAAAVRVPGRDHRRSGRLHARDPGAGRGGREGLQARAALHPAVAAGGGRDPGHDPAPDHRRRRELVGAPASIPRPACCTCPR